MTGLHFNPPARVLEGYGCTREQWIALRDVGLGMVRAGISNEKTPLRAFSHQRDAAGKRGLGWELTLMQWWGIWQDSGHWHERGLTNGYSMCRKGDLGPYAVGNVYIGLTAENASAPRKRSNLPIGVAKLSGGRNGYQAYRNVNCKLKYLGTFQTPDAARAAYEAAA